MKNFEQEKKHLEASWQGEWGPRKPVLYSRTCCCILITFLCDWVFFPVSVFSSSKKGRRGDQQ